MIIGIGSDLIDIRRIEKTLERHGQRFIDRVYTPVEQAKSDRRKAARSFLCQALCREGSLRQGSRHGPVTRRILARHGRGQPAERRTDHATYQWRGERASAQSLPPAIPSRIHLTITDDFPLAQAFVIIEASDNRRIAVFKRH